MRLEHTSSSQNKGSFSRGSRRSIACHAVEDPSEMEGDELQKGERPDFTFYFQMPSKGISDNGIADVKLAPILAKSELVIVRYDIPFGLNAAPDEASGQIVVTKDGESPQIEKVGDILRQATYWQKKRPLIIDVSKNAEDWETIVKALMTNTPQVTEDIVMVFERPNLSQRIFSGVDVCVD